MAKHRILYLGLFTGVFGLVGCEDALIDLHGVIITAEGGATGSGGFPSLGGFPSQGGAPSAGGMTFVPSECWDFSPDLPNDWQPHWASVSLLDDPTVRDEAASNALLTGTIAEIDPSLGFGGLPGAAKLTVPFASVQSDFQELYYANYAFETSLNLVGRTLTAFVKLVSGMTANDPAHPSGAKLVIKSGDDYFYADGGWNNLIAGNWVKLTLDPTVLNLDPAKDPALFDAADIREIGIAIDTSGSATQIQTPGVLYVDQICY